MNFLQSALQCVDDCLCSLILKNGGAGGGGGVRLRVNSSLTNLILDQIFVVLCITSVCIYHHCTSAASALH